MAVGRRRQRPSRHRPPPLPQTVALMVMKADATSSDATFAEALIDRTVQFGQPYPAVTHVELWIGDQPGEQARGQPLQHLPGRQEGRALDVGADRLEEVLLERRVVRRAHLRDRRGATRARRVQPALRHALPAGVRALAVPHGPSGRCAPSRASWTTASTRRRTAPRSRRASCAAPSRGPAAAAVALVRPLVAVPGDVQARAHGARAARCSDRSSGRRWRRSATSARRHRSRCTATTTSWPCRPTDARQAIQALSIQVLRAGSRKGAAAQGRRGSGRV